MLTVSGLLRERALAATVAVVTILFARVSPSTSLTLFMAAPTLLALVVGSRFAFERGLEAMIGVVALALGVLLPRALVAAQAPSLEILSDRATLLICPILLVAACRATMRSPAYGPRATLMAALVALTGVGRAKVGSTFAIGVAVFVVLATVALAATDPTRAAPKNGLVGHALRALLGMMFAGAIATGLALGIPVLHAALVDRLSLPTADRAGFSGRSIHLGAMRGMLQSDRVVMRIRNGSPEYLRGAVFSRYIGGYWEAGSLTLNKLRLSATAPADPSRSVQVEYASKPERYFLPLDATGVTAATGAYVEDDAGLRWPTSTQYAKRVTYEPGPNPQIVGPRDDEREIRGPLLAPLGDVLDRWGINPQRPPDELFEQIANELRSRYTYSVTYERTPGADPIVDFLDVHKEGHCEYFAGALALLIRRAGYATRIVTGYHVSERSALGDYEVVRDRDGHAWTEAWDGHRWVTLDATPPSSERADRETPFVSAIGDFLATTWEKVDDFLAARSPFELTLALVGLIGLLVLVRTLRARRARRLAAAPAFDVDKPLPAFEAFERALATVGLARSPTETLERFAARVEDASDPDVRATSSPIAWAAMIRAYAALRYGAVGLEEVVVRELETSTATIGRTRSR